MGSNSAGRRLRGGSGRLVLPDSNIWFLLSRASFDLDTEVRRQIPMARIRTASSVIAELRRLVALDVSGSRLALQLARRFPATRTTGRGDDALVTTARKSNAVIVTADRHLRDRLRGIGLDVLEPRGYAGFALHRGRKTGRTRASFTDNH